MRRKGLAIAVWYEVHVRVCTGMLLSINALSVARWSVDQPVWS